MKLLSPAKINLYLYVNPTKTSTHHEIVSVMYPLEFFDVIDLKIIDIDDINITFSGFSLPKKEENIVYKVLKLLKEKYNITQGFNVHIEKNIPIFSGLGGGSSNGATVLKAVNKLLNLNLSKEELICLAKEIGSDLPFFINDGGAIVSGYGEKVEPLPFYNKEKEILLLMPKKGNSTKEVYEHYIKINDNANLNNTLIKEAQFGNFDYLINNLYNDLQLPALTLNDDIKKILALLKQKGFNKYLVNGSGSCVFVFDENPSLFETFLNNHRNSFFFVKKTLIKY